MAVRPAPSAAPGTKSASPKRAYLTQAYIDSVVNRGFYELTEGTSLGEVANRQSEAITRAKTLGAQMLELARGDPNEAYIKWRVGELYAQISLEEQEISERKARERQMVSNYLVLTFNAEIGKRRPDFAQLFSLLQQLEVVDPLKANEMEESIHSRRQGISKEIVALTERYLSSGELDRAREELDYCDANMQYLRVSVATFAQLSAKLRSKLDARRERTIIAEQLKYAETMLAKDSLGAASRAAQDARSRCTSIRQVLAPQEYERTAERCAKMLAAVDRREAEMVQQNIAILQADGVDAALSFLDNDIKRARLSQANLTTLNKAMIEALVRQRQQAAQEAATVSPELASLVNGKTNPDVSVEAMTQAAKRRAQARADSIELANNKKLSRKERRELKRRQQEAAPRQERVAIATPPRTPRTPAPAASPPPPPPPPPSLSAVVQAPVSSPTPQQRAKEHLITIYLLLEQKNVGEAQSAFARYQPELRAHLVPEAFETLQYAIEQATATSQRR